MADFKETFYVTQLDANTYSYCWDKLDLANDEDSELVDCDYEQECSIDKLCSALTIHGFDTSKVLSHFKDYPCSSISLVEEY